MDPNQGYPNVIGRRPLDGVLSANHENTNHETQIGNQDGNQDGNQAADGENSIQRRFLFSCGKLEQRQFLILIYRQHEQIPATADIANY